MSRRGNYQKGGSGRKRRLRPGFVVLVAALVLVILVGFSAWQLLFGNVRPTVTVELGDPVTGADFYVHPVKQEITLLTKLNITAAGDYPVELRYMGRTYQSTLQVRDTTPPTGEAKDLTVYSSHAPLPEEFVTALADKSQVSLSFLTPPDMTKAGAQELTILLTDAAGNVTRLPVVLTVLVDGDAPVISGVTDRVFFVGQEIDLMSGITVTDGDGPAPKLVVDQGRLDLSAPGTYSITYTATDAAGNTTRQTATVTVIDDRQPPQLLGVQDLSTYVGGSISYRSHVTVSDDHDTAPVLKIDSSKVNLMEPGVYPVTYTAADAAGNVTTVTVQLTVKEKPSDYVDPEVIYARVDAILAKFIREDMTDREKVEAVYVWTRRGIHLTYGSGEHNEDWVQLANHFLDVYKGDCYSFHAIQKLMLQRLGIPTIDVRKVKNSPDDSNHVWLLVSVDGGETYYHFDNTWSKYLCLVTDAELDAFSATVDSNPFNRDPSLYPATPAEKLPESALPWEDPDILNATP